VLCHTLGNAHAATEQLYSDINYVHSSAELRYISSNPRLMPQHSGTLRVLEHGMMLWRQCVV
jgi:hypothetical protein